MTDRPRHFARFSSPIFAARFGADAIVISFHGKTGLLQNVLGSVAQDVLAEGSVPVLIVRHKA